MRKKYAEFMREDGTCFTKEVPLVSNGYVPMPRDCVDMRFFERTEVRIFGIRIFTSEPKNYTEWESVILTSKGMFD